jgi:hypothetical protein
VDEALVRRVPHPFNVIPRSRFEGVEEEIGSPNNALTLILALSSRPLQPDTRVKINKHFKLSGPCSKFWGLKLGVKILYS